LDAVENDVSDRSVAGETLEIAVFEKCAPVERVVIYKPAQVDRCGLVFEQELCVTDVVASECHIGCLASFETDAHTNRRAVGVREDAVDVVVCDRDPRRSLVVVPRSTDNNAKPEVGNFLSDLLYSVVFDGCVLDVPLDADTGGTTRGVGLLFARIL
jgi:hypothetical protein